MFYERAKAEWRCPAPRSSSFLFLQATCLGTDLTFTQLLAKYFIWRLAQKAKKKMYLGINQATARTDRTTTFGGQPRVAANIGPEGRGPREGVPGPLPRTGPSISEHSAFCLQIKSRVLRVRLRLTCSLSGVIIAYQNIASK